MKFSDNSMSPIEVQITDAVALLQESVVTIGSVRLRRDFRYGAVPLEGQGTGVIVDEKGYIVTNNHVVDGAERVQVTLKDDRTFTGEVVGADRPTDVALVRIEASDLRAAKLRRLGAPEGGADSPGHRQCSRTAWGSDRLDGRDQCHRTTTTGRRLPARGHGTN